MEVADVDNSKAGMPSDQVTIERRTLMQQAYAAIRQMIITGELAVSTKVVVRPLCERRSLSPTPIKAALAGLERDGFLTAIPHRGYYVPEVNVQDMREIYELREVLDGIAAAMDQAECCGAGSVLSASCHRARSDRNSCAAPCPERDQTLQPCRSDLP